MAVRSVWPMCEMWPLGPAGGGDQMSQMSKRKSPEAVVLQCVAGFVSIIREISETCESRL